MLDKFHDECGVVGVFGHLDAANLAYLGLYALQHRGQESAGIAASNNGKMHLEVGMGLVADVFSDARLKKLPGNIAIGHNYMGILVCYNEVNILLVIICVCLYFDNNFLFFMSNCSNSNGVLLGM